MDEPARPGRYSLRDQPATVQWAVLLAATAALILPLEVIHLPAGLLLGAMGAAILVAVLEGTPAPPQWAYVIAQGLIGCLVARSIGADILHTMLQHWPVFLAGVGMVLVFSTTLGAVLARFRVLPGSTAVWGSAPGAATVMVLMAEAFGGDTRLVAFMQFLRVMLVALLASVVARLWTAGSGAPPAIVWFPQLPPGPLCATLALAIGGAWLGAKLRIPAGPLLLPLVAGAVLSLNHVLTITLPPWLLAGCYALVGWIIGLRFTRDIVRYALRVLPRVTAAILALMLLCAALGWVLHLVLGIDPLTAYLATSPGGADSIAIIAAASPKVDLPFVMAMQSARFLLVLLAGPALARMVARWPANSYPRTQK